MKPCLQTSFGDKQGNCFSACIASLLELAIEDVPNFCVDYGEDDWQNEAEKWLGKRGLALVSVQINEEVPAWDFYWMAGGKSGRGIYHAVIYRAGELVHDPHPSGCGINGDPTDGFVILPLDLGQWTFILGDDTRRPDMANVTPTVTTIQYDREGLKEFMAYVLGVEDGTEPDWSLPQVSRVNSVRVCLGMSAEISREQMAELVEEHVPQAEGYSAFVTMLGENGMNVKLTKKPEGQEQATDDGDTEEETAKGA